MNGRFTFSRVLWAVDPLVKDKTAQNITGEFLKTISQSFSFEVKPVGVILEAQIPCLVGPSETTSDFVTKLEGQLKEWLSLQGIPHLIPPQILVEPSFSIKSAVENLLQYAEKQSFNLIVASTHAKLRTSPTELGTFSETLFLLSSLDILLVNPTARVPSRYSQIFFPTDISSASLDALNSIQEFAKSLKAHLTLFYKSPNFTKDVVEFPLSSDARSLYLERVNAFQQEELEQAVSSLRSQGVSADWLVDRISADYVSKAIVSRAEQFKSFFIAMLSHTTDSQKGLPGSTTRQVIRNTNLPVLILHTKKEPIYGSKKT
jgi:nucleotide-binding universal stress UspA family protein